MADPQEVALSDEEVFGPESDAEVLGRSVNLSPLERAFEEIAEGARSSSLASAKATIEEAAARFEKVTASIKEANAEAVAEALKNAMEKIAGGARVDTSVIREIVAGIKMPDLAPLDAIRSELERVGKLVEGTHGAIAGSIRALREEFLEAMRAELKVEVKAPQVPAPERPTEWHFDIEYDDRGEPRHVVARTAETSPPRTPLEAATRVAQ